MKEYASIIDETLNSLNACETCPGVNVTKGANLPGQKAMVEVLDECVNVLFPGCYDHEPMEETALSQKMRERLERVAVALEEMIQRVKMFECVQTKCQECGDCRAFAEKVCAGFLRSLGDIRKILHDDVMAAYEGDPAARSTMEVIMSYPGIYAIAVHRIAHSLHGLGVPLIPRVMSEHAHTRTGIDIHPGATIGAGFFIDHGTGVVIGETCVIGKNVKLYQGVTLGALSFAKDEQGRLIKGNKRHPNVEDDVIIYAGATILGGDTVIGKGSVVGGNVWIVRSLPAGSTVFHKSADVTLRPRA
jgi:serine O-acetyltransferase